MNKVGGYRKERLLSMIKDAYVRKKHEIITSLIPEHEKAKLLAQLESVTVNSELVVLNAPEFCFELSFFYWIIWLKVAVFDFIDFTWRIQVIQKKIERKPSQVLEIPFQVQQPHKENLKEQQKEQQKEQHKTLDSSSKNQIEKPKEPAQSLDEIIKQLEAKLDDERTKNKKMKKDIDDIMPFS